MCLFLLTLDTICTLCLFVLIYEEIKLDVDPRRKKYAFVTVLVLTFVRKGREDLKKIICNSFLRKYATVTYFRNFIFVKFGKKNL